MGKTVSISFEFVYVSLGEEVHPNVLAQEAELKEEIFGNQFLNQMYVIIKDTTM